jgi:hypothetical protein
LGKGEGRALKKSSSDTAHKPEGDDTKSSKVQQKFVLACPNIVTEHAAEVSVA